MLRGRRGFTLLEMLLLLALVAAFSAAALRPRSHSGQFRRTAALLQSYLQGAVDHVRFRDHTAFRLLVGSSAGESSADELLLIEEGEQASPVPGFHLSLKNFGTIVTPGAGENASNFCDVSAASVEGVAGTWYAVAAETFLNDSHFCIVLRSADRRPALRRFFISTHGTVLSESL